MTQKIYRIPEGKIVQLPDISTDFYAKLQDIIFLLASPELLVQIKTELGDEEYYRTIGPAFEFLGALEEKMIKDKVAVEEDLKPE